jgi:hypothetical protein
MLRSTWHKRFIGEYEYDTTTATFSKIGELFYEEVGGATTYDYFSVQWIGFDW